MAAHVLLLLSLTSAVEVHLWASDLISTWSNRATLDAACSTDVPGAIALVCTAQKDASSYFSETFNIVTRAVAGDSWNLSVPVATAGTVQTQLFTLPTHLGTTVRTFDGSSTGTDCVSTSCMDGGIFASGNGCGSNNFAASTGTTTCGTSDSDWMSTSTGYACSSSLRVYCIDGVTRAPTRTPTARTPTASPVTRTPTSATPVPTPIPTSIPNTSVPTPAPNVSPTPPLTKAPTPPTTAAPIAPSSSSSTTAPSRTPTVPTTRIPTSISAAPTPPTVSRAPTPPTTPPTPPTTRAPTAPTAPTPPTTRYPSSLPTTHAPTPPTAPTAPTTRAPTPPTAPTAPTTRYPTRAPTQPLKTTAPTAYPCDTCVAVVRPGATNSNSSNSSAVFVGDPSTPVSVLVDQGSVPNCTNCSVWVTLRAQGSGPAMVSAASDSLLWLQVYDGAAAGFRNGVVPLGQAMQFTMPYAASLASCTGLIVGQCVAWTGTAWDPAACVSADTSSGTLCTCTQLGLFSVQLDPSAPDPCVGKAPPELYFAFTAIYVVIFAYCIFAVLGLWRAGFKAHENSMVQHSLIATVALLRFLSCLSSAQAFGNSPFLAFFVAAPYALELYLFPRITNVWPDLVPYAMLGVDAKWRRVRKFFLGTALLGLIFAVLLFIIDVMPGLFNASVGFTCVLAGIYVAEAIGFNIYARKIITEMGMGQGGLSIVRSRDCFGAVGGIRYLGRTASAWFVVQAVCSILVLVAPIPQYTGWIAAFFTANVLALVFILLAYGFEMLKAVNAFSSQTLAKLEEENSYKSGRQTSARKVSNPQDPFSRSGGVELSQVSSRESQIDETEGTKTQAVVGLNSGGHQRALSGGNVERPPPPNSLPAQSSMRERPPPPNSLPSMTTANMVPEAASLPIPTNLEPRKSAKGPSKPCGGCGIMLDPREVFCSDCGRPTDTKECPRCGLEHRAKYLNCVGCGSQFGLLI